MILCKSKTVLHQFALFGRCCSTATTSSLVEQKTVQTQLPERQRPVFAVPRVSGSKVYQLVTWKNNEMLADYTLFEESMAKSKVSWLSYNGMTSDEKSIYLAHYRAIQERKLFYKCPLTNTIHKTVSQLLYNKTCCGEACRHCPFELENCDEKVKKSFIWNSAYYV